MQTLNPPVPHLSCVRRLLAVVAITAGYIHAPAHAQVIESNYPTSSLTTQNPNGSWTGWGLGGFAYGAGSNANGSSGVVSHNYDFASNLIWINIGISELRNTYFVIGNTASQQHVGQVEFTPQTNTQYLITGNVNMVLTGFDISSTTATGTATLEAVAGPTLATYGGVVSRTASQSLLGSLFDASAPLGGASSGTLLAGVTYRFSWNYLVTSVFNGDTSLSADIFTGFGPSFMQIEFIIPAPGAAALLGIAGIAAGRKRR